MAYYELTPPKAPPQQQHWRCPGRGGFSVPSWGAMLPAPARGGGSSGAVGPACPASNGYVFPPALPDATAPGRGRPGPVRGRDRRGGGEGGRAPSVMPGVAGRSRACPRARSEGDGGEPGGGMEVRGQGPQGRPRQRPDAARGNAGLGFPVSRGWVASCSLPAGERCVFPRGTFP